MSTPESAPQEAASPFASASVEAKRLAAAVLEVLAGARLPSEAASVLEISLARYYQLETRALAGLVSACEGRRRGRGRKSGSEVADLRRNAIDCVVNVPGNKHWYAPPSAPWDWRHRRPPPAATRTARNAARGSRQPGR